MTDREMEVVMANANRAYDHGDYDEARQFAGQVLIRQPSNARMLRILVSSSCIEGDAVTAQASMAQLSRDDQEQMRARCQRYSINLTVSAGP
jgi:Tfp pilus assembly protein PilF